jgi:type IV pilus assembly protein PilM
LTFGVAYGLCVQALDSGQLRTNLLPDEIVTTRLVRAKKPWAVAAAALLLAGLTINFFGHYSAMLTADITDPQMSQELSAAKKTSDEAKKLAADNAELKTKFETIKAIGNGLQSNVDGRLLWLEVLKAVDAALPKDTRPPEQRKETDEDLAKRPELHFQSMDCEYFADLTPWKNSIAPLLAKSPPPAPAAAGTDAAGAAATPAGTAAPAATPPAAAPPATPPADATAAGAPPAEGAAAIGGWVFELRGYHLHNNLTDKNIDVGDEGEKFVRETFIKNLETGKVSLPDGPGGQLVEVPIADLGIQFPVVVTNQRVNPVTYMAEPADTANGTVPTGPEGAAMSIGAGGDQPKTFKLRQYDFIVQFCWQPQPRGHRLEKMAEKKPPATGEAPAGTAAAGEDAAHAKPSS